MTDSVRLGSPFVWGQAVAAADRYLTRPRPSLARRSIAVLSLALATTSVAVLLDADIQAFVGSPALLNVTRSTALWLLLPAAPALFFALATASTEQGYTRVEGAVDRFQRRALSREIAALDFRSPRLRVLRALALQRTADCWVWLAVPCMVGLQTLSALAANRSHLSLLSDGVPSLLTAIVITIVVGPHLRRAAQSSRFIRREQRSSSIESGGADDDRA